VLPSPPGRGASDLPPSPLGRGVGGEGQSVVVEYEPDPDLRDTEQVPLLEDGGIDAFLRREVLPHAADAWYDPDSVKTGYEVIRRSMTSSCWTS
jgi:type I restriction enzyme M protein